MQKRGTDPALNSDDYIRRACIGVAVVAGIVLTLDQITKSLAVEHLEGRVVHVIGPLRLVLAFNKGIAFGAAERFAPVLVTLAIGAIFYVLYKQRAVLGRPAFLGIGLALGGALGNVCDRLFRDRGGAVVDFIDLQWWPVFNLADSAIVAGAIILLIWGSRAPTGS